jgi:collagen type III alpha
MASTTDHSSGAELPAVDDAAAHGPDAHGPGTEGYVDFDEYIEIQLHKAGSTIKSTDVLTAVVGAGTLLTAYLLTFIVCDQWLIPGGFGGTARVALLLSLLVAVVAWLGWKVIWPWRRRVNGLYAASTIEKASPGFKGSLLNLVDLLRAERTISPEVYRSLERRAAVALTHVDVRETVDRHSLLRLSMALFAVVVLFCGYWILSPKNPASSLWRAIAPASDAAVATRTKIDSVRPGDVDVVARSQVDVTAEVRGQLPAQATLYYTTADHKFVDERIDARPSAEASREFHFVINGDNGAGILQDMSYRIVAGDDETREYKIHVIQPPAATIDSIRLDYPGYTRLTSATQTTGAIDALEGTRVTLRATANMPLRSASLQFFDDESAAKRGEEVPVHVENGNKLQAEWTLQIRSDGTCPHFYRIFCTSAGGESERSPSLYSLEIRGDRPPEIVLRDPTKDLELPANAVLPLLIEARDPDFALSYINLKIEKDGASVIGPEIYDGKDNPAQQVRKTYRWSLKEYHFRPKDTITYWLEAQDNRKPLANTTNSSPRLRIHIIDPVPESEVQKQLEMAENNQQQEKRTDDNNGQPKDEDSVADPSKPQPKAKQRNANSQQQQPPQNQQRDANQKQPDQQNNDVVIPQRPHKGRPSPKPGIGGGDKGVGDKGGKGSGEKGADDKGGDQGNGENGDKGQSQKPNADDPASDSQALQKIYDHMQQDSKKSDSGQDDNAKDKGSENPSGDKSGDKKGGDSSQNDPSAKDNQPGQPGANPQPGAQPQGQDGQKPDGQKPDGKNPDGKNPEGQNPDGKSPDGQNKGGKSADGTKPDTEPNAKQGEKKEGATPDGSKKTDPSAGDKNGADQPRDKSAQDKSAADKSAADKSGADKSPDTKQAIDKENEGKPNGQRQVGQKQPGDKTEEGQQPPDQQSKKDQNGKNGDGKDQPDKQPGDKQPGGKTGENPAGDKQEQKQQGDKSPDGKSEQDKSQQGKSGDQKSQDQKSGDQKSSDDKSQGQSKEAQGKNEKGQPSPGDQSHSDSKSQGRSADQNSQRDQSPPKSDASKGSNSGEQQDKNQQSKSGVQPQDASQRNGGQDQGQKKDPKSADQSPASQGQPKGSEQNRKDGTKPTDATGRDADRSQQKQPQDGVKPHAGEPQGTPDVKSRDVPQGDERDDKSKAKNRPARSQDLEEIPKGVDQPTDKLHAKSARDEQQPNNKGDEQSDVGKDGDTKRTQDKNSRLSQEGTDKPGAKELTTKQDPAAKNGREQAADQASGQQQGKSDKAPKSGDPAKSGQPEKGGAAKPGQQPQDGKASPDSPQQKDGQPADGQGKPSSQSGKSGEGKPGEPGQTSSKGEKGGDKPSKGGSSAAGMGNGKGTNNGGGGHNSGNGSGDGEGLVNTEKQANVDYARQATDLMLNRLQGQLSRGKVDDKLLKDLGWTKDEVRRFVDRMRRQLQSEQGGNSPADEARRLQLLETLKSLDLRQGPKARSGSGLQKVGGDEIARPHSTPPAEYKEQYDAFTRSVGQPTAPREKK